jgi:predicted nucleic acid-binding protein
LIFVDTTIWVSGLDSADSLHEDGRAVLEAIVDGNLSPALTTDFVLDETLTLLKRRGAKSDVVVKALENLLASSLVRVVYVEETLFLEALSSFKKYERLSFTDAVTMAAMQRYKIKDIFSHDRDFDVKGIVRKERP